MTSIAIYGNCYQRSEINSLKEEVREAPQSVASEVEKITTVYDIHWQLEGNRLQFEFNNDVENSLKQTLWALENGKCEYAGSPVTSSRLEISTSGLPIPLKDAVKHQYVSNPLASDSKDETFLNRPESPAVKKKKTQQKP